MKHSSISGISAAGKKASPTAMARVLLVGLALLLPGMAALAIANDPLTDGLIIIRNKSGGIPITTPTSSDGTYKFKGLAPGNYDLFVGGQRVQTVAVGANRSISGVLSSEPDGKTSITFNGQVGVVPDLPNAIVTTRSNIKRPSKVDAAPEGITPILDVDGNSSTDPIVAAPKGGGGKLPGILRLINNSETDRSSVEASNRDHIDQDAQTGGPGNGIRVSADVSTLRITRSTASGRITPIAVDPTDATPDISDQGAAGNLSTYSVAPRPEGGAGNLPGLAGDPIPGVDVKLGKNPGGIVASSRTDSQGNFHFDNLPAGNYELILPGLPSQLLAVGTDGIAGGKVMRGPDGSMSIFDRWGIRTADSPKSGGSKTAEKPIGFGSGNTMGAGPGGMGPGPMSPATMSPGPMGGAMAPGGGGAMGPGRAMGGAGMGRP